MNIKETKGATLTEVIITVAILMIIMAPISLIFITSYTSYINENDKATAQQSAREILYGNSINSYGILSDLERSGAMSKDIYIDGVTDDIDVSGTSLLIKNITSGEEKKYIFEPGEKGKLTNGAGVIYNDPSVIVDAFVVQKLKRNSENDCDSLKILIEVHCGNSGKVSYESTYRFQDIET